MCLLFTFYFVSEIAEPKLSNFSGQSKNLLISIETLVL